jgi:hypothetical protein
MKYPKQLVLDVSETDIYRSYVFGDSPLQFALRRRHDVPPTARVGEFLLSMGDGWNYRTPVVAQRFIIKASVGKLLRPRTFTFEDPFYIDPAITMKRPAPKPSRKTRAKKEIVRRG